MPDKFDFGDIIEIESFFPNIVRFLRKAMVTGTPEYYALQKITEKHEMLKRKLVGALSGKLPETLIKSVICELGIQEFYDGIQSCVHTPDCDNMIRKFVKEWFSNKGIVFEYGEY